MVQISIPTISILIFLINTKQVKVYGWDEVLWYRYPSTPSPF